MGWERKDGMGKVRIGCKRIRWDRRTPEGMGMGKEWTRRDRKEKNRIEKEKILVESERM